MVIYQYSNCWVILSGSIALISLTGSITLMDILITMIQEYYDYNDTRIFWFQWYKNIQEFFWVCRTIPTRRDTNLRAQLWGPRNSSMWSFPIKKIYVISCFFCAGGKRTIGLLLNQKAAVILDKVGGDPCCHTYLDKAPRISISIVIWILSSDTETSATTPLGGGARKVLAK